MFIVLQLAPHVSSGTRSTQHTEMLFLFARRSESFADSKGSDSLPGIPSQLSCLPRVCMHTHKGKDL